MNNIRILEIYNKTKIYLKNMKIINMNLTMINKKKVAKNTII
jgi:hypothetical protein